VLNASARKLASRFWPGQLTVVVPKREDYDSEALAGSLTVGLRVPDNAVAQAVIEGLGAPVTGTSANMSGGPDPVTADEVQHQLGKRVDLILDAGRCDHGIASTVVDCTGAVPVILRQGAVAAEQILAALKD
jgi:L-threonylcarbamoyladenylate synthase